jgi:phosphotransferase system  glucose/maltose/N-acetylglucosamine-specific IIC component
MSFLDRPINAIYAWLHATFTKKTAARIASGVLVLQTLVMIVLAPLAVLLMAIWGAVSNSWVAIQDAYYTAYDNFQAALSVWKSK